MKEVVLIKPQFSQDHRWPHFYILYFGRLCGRFYLKLASVHSLIHTPTAESPTQGDSQLVRSSQGEEPEMEPTTFRLPVNPPCLLSHSRPYLSLRGGCSHSALSAPAHTALCLCGSAGRLGETLPLLTPSLSHLQHSSF